MIPIFNRNFIFCMDLGILHKVCNDRITFPKSDEIRKILGSVAGERIFGDHGLLKDPGSNLWLAKRRAMDPAFRKASLKSITNGVNMVTDHLIRRLQRNCSSQPLDITKEMTRAGFETISVCGFNWNEEVLEKHGEETLQHAVVIIDTISLVLREKFTFDFPWSRLGEKQKLKESVPKIRSFIKEHLLNRMKSLPKNGDKNGDILSHIMKSNQCSDQLTIDDLVDEYLLFLMAGMDTTAITMATTLFYLTAHPDILAKAQSEVDEVFGNKTELEFEDLNKLVYLELVIKEAMRIKPAVTWTTRQCKKHNVSINGVRIPKEAEIMVPIQSIHMDPSLWDRPNEFLPERFLPEARRNSKPLSYLPFMIGQRSCIGRNFAMLVSKTVLSRVIREFDLEGADPGLKDVEMGGALTSRPVNGVNLKLSCRR